MFRRALLRRFAVVGILGLLVAQVLSTAHACARDRNGHGDAALAQALSDATAARATSAQPSGHVSGHCPGHDVPVDGTGPSGHGMPPEGNLCQLHCSDAVSPERALDVPDVMLAALPLAAGTRAVDGDRDQATPTRFPARSGSPPLILRFGRLLI